MFGCVWHQNGCVAKQSTTMAVVLREYLINLKMKSDHLKHEIQIRANISWYSTLYHGLFLTIFLNFFWVVGEGGVVGQLLDDTLPT